MPLRLTVVPERRGAGTAFLASTWDHHACRWPKSYACEGFSNFGALNTPGSGNAMDCDLSGISPVVRSVIFYWAEISSSSP